MVTYRRKYLCNNPWGFDHANKTLVCKLNKAISGLKHAPRASLRRLATTLCNFGFVASVCDPSLFIRITSHTTTYILVYVDNILITGNSPAFFDSLK